MSQIRPVGREEIDLNSSIFPMPGELLINVLRIQQEKDALIVRRQRKQELKKTIYDLTDRFREHAEELMNLETSVADFRAAIDLLDAVNDADEIEELNNEIADLEPRIEELSDIADTVSQNLVYLTTQMRQIGDVETEMNEFTSIYSRQGYGDSFDDIGRNKLENGGLKPDDYNPLAFNALKTMYRAFRTPGEKSLNEQEILEKYKEWQDKVVGKAKLIPGKHHLLFGPFTVRYIHRLLSQFEERFDEREVDQVRKEILRSLQGAEGLPWYTEEYVKEHVGGAKVVPTLARYDNVPGEISYRRAWWNFRNQHPTGWEKEFAAALPGTLGKKGPEGEPLQTVAPWFWDPVSEDTSSAKGDSKS
jgi:hypothetical protein